jgi:hypothetical protein
MSFGTDLCVTTRIISYLAMENNKIIICKTKQQIYYLHNLIFSVKCVKRNALITFALFVVVFIVEILKLYTVERNDK